MPKLLEPITSSNASPYERLCNAWKNCQLCDLHKNRKQVVFARGVIPADIVYVGEGPGDSEDILGAPFVGPAGHLFDEIIKRALARSGLNAARMAWFNLVGCIPKDEEGRKKGEPTAKEIEACYPRLERFLKIAKPKLVVCVGKLAEQQAKLKDWHSQFKQVVDILHPSAALKAENAADKVTMINRIEARLTSAFGDFQIPY